jgi:RNA polymerase sigma-70 factor (ECF subfamily)
MCLCMAITAEKTCMADGQFHTMQLHGWVERIRQGDRAAPDELLRHVGERLRLLAQRMLLGYRDLKRWIDTDDVFQNALVRLLRALEAVTPPSTREFFGLVSLQLRRELIDLARRWRGKMETSLDGSWSGGSGVRAGHRDPRDSTHEPSRLAEWAEFHQHIEALPEEERAVVDLIFYQGLAQAEAADLLGISVRTLQRRWNAALLRLHPLVNGQQPPT